MDTFNKAAGGGGGSDSGGNAGGGNPWGNSGGNNSGGGATDTCAGNFYMNGYTIVCGCSGYTWSTAGNKCVPGGGSGDNGGTPAGFTGWGGETGGASSGGSGGGYTGGVHTDPGGGTFGGTCDPAARYDASCKCCICPDGNPEMYGQGCN